jgi:hypothetical protein
MYAERVVMTDAAAFMTKSGTLASTVSGAIAITVGVHTMPARKFTRSRTMSSCASCFPLSGLGPPSSRVITSTVTPGGSLPAFIFW